MNYQRAYIRRLADRILELVTRVLVPSMFTKVWVATELELAEKNVAEALGILWKERKIIRVKAGCRASCGYSVYRRV